MDAGGWGSTPSSPAAELVTAVVMEVMLRFTSEARSLRHATKHLGHLSPYLPGQAGYNKRSQRAAGASQRDPSIAGEPDTRVIARPSRGRRHSPSFVTVREIP
ncbi:MAG: hypothetical protein ACLPVY_00560 [Acidimicrobiia bacterium]